MERLLDYYVHLSSYVEQGAVIGEGTKIWHFSHVMKGAQIGKNCVLGQNVFVGQNVVIGDNVKIQNNVSVYEGVTIDDDVFVGPSVVFTNVKYPRATIDRSQEFIPTVIKKGATIGANATIICGNTIGKYAMIGAGAVVSDDVDERALMIGVPAKKAGYVCICGEALAKELDSNCLCEQCLSEDAESKDSCITKESI